MYARVTTTNIKPDQWDEAIRITEDSVVPAAKQQKGFKGYLALADRATGKTIVITFWETEANRQASGRGGEYYQEVMSKVVPLLTVEPVVEDFEVAFQV